MATVIAPQAAVSASANVAATATIPAVITSTTRTLQKPLNLADFDLGVTVGTGSFGRVRFATHKVEHPYK